MGGGAGGVDSFAYRHLCFLFFDSVSIDSPVCVCSLLVCLFFEYGSADGMADGLADRLADRE